MQRLVEASNDRLFRTQAAFQVIRAMRAAESSAALDVGTAIGHGDE